MEGNIEGSPWQKVGRLLDAGLSGRLEPACASAGAVFDAQGERILALAAAGFSYKQLSSMFEHAGIRIAPASLKTYVWRFRKKSGAPTAAQGRRPPLRKTARSARPSSQGSVAGKSKLGRPLSETGRMLRTALPALAAAKEQLGASWPEVAEWLATYGWKVSPRTLEDAARNAGLAAGGRGRKKTDALRSAAGRSAVERILSESARGNGKGREVGDG